VSADRGSEFVCWRAMGVKEPESEDADEARRLRRRIVEGECCLWFCKADEDMALEEPPSR
jgi:hypothetical protein